ncbi:general odorant-binding protein 1 [Papilio machaon]|uniref:general odorant-binding protein 1 n=1 Tax=Papilio machaon TaxID=76193 RepID=UPI001E663A0B|nr:general odorant-binding protein 1 [Papilio machaon]
MAASNTILNPRWRLVAVCVLCAALRPPAASASQQVMKQLTVGFMKAMDVCRKEMNLGDHILQDFMNFWREEYELVNRELGCAITCIVVKLNLITEDFKMHHDNAREFAIKHGADEDIAKQLVSIIHDCERSNEAESDECLRVLEISKCFRTKIHQLNWAPSMEVLLEEIMTEI